VEELSVCIRGTLNLPAINTLGRKAANILGAKSEVPESNSFFIHRTFKRQTAI
jgi:hypothetical protein